MTISDVLKTPEFYNNLKVVISDLENTRRKAGMMADAPLKRHQIDRLQERGVFEPGNLNGYKIVGLRKKDFHKTYLVHVLIAKSFIENPHKKQFVDHIDTNRSNNNVSNLRWVTRLENNNNPITLSKLKLSARDISKPVLQLKNGVIVKEYNSINEAAKINGFSPIAICKVCKGERKNHKGYMWRYKNEKA